MTVSASAIIEVPMYSSISAVTIPRVRQMRFPNPLFELLKKDSTRVSFPSIETVQKENILAQ